MGSILGLGISPGEGNGSPLQYSCLENPMDKGPCSPWGCKELDMSLQLNNDNSKLDNRLLFMIHLYFFYCYEKVIENEI